MTLVRTQPASTACTLHPLSQIAAQTDGLSETAILKDSLKLSQRAI